MDTQSKSWQDLAQYRNDHQHITLKQRFADNPERFQRYHVEAAGLLLDFSKHHIDQQCLSLLLKLAEEAQLGAKIQDLLAGKPVNNTEDRPALHTALRSNTTDPLLVHGTDIRPLVQAQLAKMRDLVQTVHQGDWVGYSRKKITDVVNIGIGGSDLGPKMVYQALAPHHVTQVRCHFVSNVDGCNLAQTLEKLNPETTLFLVASKSFTTQETLLNATSARTWLLDKAKDPAATAKHFVAISTNRPKVEAFGIATNNIFDMWDWVGGRYSLWSSIGLSIALGVGMDTFDALRAGAAAMDQHFGAAPLHQNMPVIMGLLGMWYHNFWDAESQAVIPYMDQLSELPNYLQQLDMESNGKRVQVNGDPVAVSTGPIIWGGIGTNGQHAFHQLLHQGTHCIPVDFILSRQSDYDLPEHQAALYANCLAQSQALMQGKTLEEAKVELTAAGCSAEGVKRLAPHKVIPGNRPSSTILMEKLTPETLGALIALYEHKVYVQSVLWNINAFDQWGVELGKQLGKPILSALKGEVDLEGVDSSTAALIRKWK